MEYNTIKEDTIIDDRFTVARKLGGDETICVYSGLDAKRNRPVGITLFVEKPADRERLHRDAMRFARLSDFGSHSRKRLNPKYRGQIYIAGDGYTAGIWYEAWYIHMNLLTNPYPYTRPSHVNFSSPTRRALLQVAEGYCQVCSRPGQLDIDHIVPVVVEGTGASENAIALCEDCHKAKTLVQHRLLAISTLDIKEQQRFYGREVKIHLTGKLPYHIELPDLGFHQFSSKEDAWNWLTRQAKTLVTVLPEAVNVMRMKLYFPGEQ